MDLRDVRKQFFDKKLAYACSYDPVASFDSDEVMAVPGGGRLTVERSLGSDSAPFGNFFHVLDATSVTGVDDRKHDCPVGEIDYFEEALLLQENSTIGIIAGRMTFTTTDRTTIDVQYSGRLRFSEQPRLALAMDHDLRAAASIVPIFSTADTRYQWLSVHACFAFGTWSAPFRPSRTRRQVTANLDVYSAG